MMHQQLRLDVSDSGAMQQDRSFGPHTIRGSEIFAETPLSFAFVNLKPVVPGEMWSLAMRSILCMLVWSCT